MCFLLKKCLNNNYKKTMVLTYRCVVFHDSCILLFCCILAVPTIIGMNSGRRRKKYYSSAVYLSVAGFLADPLP